MDKDTTKLYNEITGLSSNINDLIDFLAERDIENKEIEESNKNNFNTIDAFSKQDVLLTAIINESKKTNELLSSKISILNGFDNVEKIEETNIDTVLPNISSDLISKIDELKASIENINSIISFNINNETSIYPDISSRFKTNIEDIITNIKSDIESITENTSVPIELDISSRFKTNIEDIITNIKSDIESITENTSVPIELDIDFDITQKSDIITNIKSDIELLKNEIIGYIDGDIPEIVETLNNLKSSISNINNIPNIDTDIFSNNIELKIDSILKSINELNSEEIKTSIESIKELYDVLNIDNNSTDTNILNNIDTESLLNEIDILILKLQNIKPINLTELIDFNQDNFIVYIDEIKNKLEEINILSELEVSLKFDMKSIESDINKIKTLSDTKLNEYKFGLKEFELQNNDYQNIDIETSSNPNTNIDDQFQNRNIITDPIISIEPSIINDIPRNYNFYQNNDIISDSIKSLEQQNNEILESINISNKNLTDMLLLINQYINNSDPNKIIDISKENKSIGTTSNSPSPTNTTNDMSIQLLSTLVSVVSQSNIIQQNMYNTMLSNKFSNKQDYLL